MTRQKKKYWPVSQRNHLLKAAFLEDEVGLHAWETWKSSVDMDDHPDLGSYRLLPQLFKNLKKQGIEDPLTMKLKGIIRRNWYHNQRFFKSLSPTLQAFHEAEIKVMLLQNPAIALAYKTDYPLADSLNPVFLVPAPQASRAIQHLQDWGWQPVGGLPEQLVEPYLASGWELDFHDNSGAKIHLQWHLLPECRTNSADDLFWRSARSASVHNSPAFVLDPADQILYSCVEDGSVNQPSSYLRAIDVLLVAEAEPHLDWGKLLRLIKKQRLVAPVKTVLTYIEEHLVGFFPEAVWRQIQALPVSSQERLEFQLKRSRPLAWRGFWQQWYSYRRSRSDGSLVLHMQKFPRHLQYVYRLYRLRQVPRQLLIRANQR